MSATNWVEETLAFNTHSMNYDECSSTSKQVNQFNKFISTWLDLFHASVKPFRVIWSNRSTSFQVFDVIISQLVPIELVILSYTLVKLFIRSGVECSNEPWNVHHIHDGIAKNHYPFLSRSNRNKSTSIIHGRDADKVATRFSYLFIYFIFAAAAPPTATIILFFFWNKKWIFYFFSFLLFEKKKFVCLSVSFVSFHFFSGFLFHLNF